MEILRDPAGRRFTSALFDFDGTISLIRQGWQEIMTALELEILSPLAHGRAEADLTAMIADDIAILTGKQTIFQMIRLSQRVAEFGGKPLEPIAYKREYNQRLMRRIAHRRAALADASAAPESMMVRGARAFVEELRLRGLKLYLTSGTDEAYVLEEARLLKVDNLFAGGIFGALEERTEDTKAAVIARLMSQEHLNGRELLGVGDGFVEIENTKAVGGYAVGVASDELANDGQVDEWKRRRLIAAGADLIVPDFAQAADLAEMLVPRKPQT
jgi:phosphoglycolate phosphatase